MLNYVLGRLSKRHLSIMAKNSAFKGFQFPKSRHGSMTSTGSTSNLASNNVNKSGRRSGGIQSRTANPSSQRRHDSVEKSVFSVLFPSWPNEAVYFLTVCLDPETSNRPSCSGLMRLPYFTMDNFPTRFVQTI